MTTDATSPSPGQPEGNTAGRSHRWFHFRWQTLLVIPLAILVLLLVYGPRQYKQKQAIAALKGQKATVRTSPVAVPLVSQIAGVEYAQEITEVYWRDPN